jgi:hypothetical protein
MKNPVDVLRVKEQELVRVRLEIEALRIATRLLGDDEEGVGAVPPPAVRGNGASKIMALP